MKFAATLLSILSISVAFVHAQEGSASRAEVIRQLQQGQNQAAVALAQQALQTAPRDCALLSLEAIGETGLGHTEAALALFRKTLTLCPTYLPALEGAAQIQFARGNPDAPVLIRRILVLKPEDPAANAMLATTLSSQGKCSEALDHFRASTPLFPARPDLVEAYSACLASTGDPDAALTQSLHLLASHPNDNTRYNVALLQWKTHATEAALETLAPLLSPQHPVSPLALALASRIHEERTETPQAVALLREAILSSPDNVDNYLDFATIAFNHKSFEVGIDMLNAGLERQPDSAALHVARGVLEAQLSKSAAAIDDFRQAHRLDPRMSFAMDVIGVMQSQQHQNGDALKLFETEATQHPDDPLLQYLLAEQLSQAGGDSGNLRAAITAAKRAATLDPSYQAAHDLLAVLYVRAKQPQLAIQEAERALARDPDDVDALYQELMARRSSGDTQEIRALTVKLDEARNKVAQRQQGQDRYRLQRAVKP